MTDSGETVASNDLMIGIDGVARCAWGASTPEYQRYHDQEWGREVRGVQRMYERLSLEAFQSGLSWITILRKRENFRVAFAGFDPEAVALYGEHDVERLMSDVGIVRNRAKILATITNAKATLALEVDLDELLWSFRPPDAEVHPRSFAEVPAITAESTAMSKELKRRGFAFVGPTTCYAAMQATGITDDHLVGCHRAEVG